MSENTIKTGDAPTFDVEHLQKLVQQEPTPEPTKEPGKEEEPKKPQTAPAREVIPADNEADKLRAAMEDLAAGKEEEEDDDDYQRPEIQDVIDTFNIARQEGLLLVPDDFEFDGSEEKLTEAYELDQKAREEIAEQNLFTFISPELREAIEFERSGRGNADLTSFVQLRQQEQTFESIDISTPEAQKEILKYYYKNQSGLSDNRVNTILESIEDEGDAALKTEAEKVKEFYVGQVKAQKQAFVEQTKQQALQQEQAARQFEQDFNKAMTEQKYSKAKQQEVLSQFQMVKYGEEIVPTYQAKLASVYSNPQHFLQLMDLLAAYNPQQGFTLEEFTTSKASQEAASKRDNWRRKSKQQGTGGSRSSEKKPFIPINPADANIENY